MKYNIGMKSINIIALMYYVASLGLAVALWNENLYFIFKMASITVLLLMIFSIINNYE